MKPTFASTVSHHIWRWEEWLILVINSIFGLLTAERPAVVFSSESEPYTAFWLLGGEPWLLFSWLEKLWDQIQKGPLHCNQESEKWITVLAYIACYWVFLKYCLCGLPSLLARQLVSWAVGNYSSLHHRNTVWNSWTENQVFQQAAELIMSNLLSDVAIVTLNFSFSDISSLCLSPTMHKLKKKKKGISRNCALCCLTS